VVATLTKGGLFWSRRQVRMRFLELCPYDVFKTAIEGFTHELHYSDEQFEGVNRHYWR
jgi:hypothetical protein